jgi:hypothetical protein
MREQSNYAVVVRAGGIRMNCLMQSGRGGESGEQNVEHEHNRHGSPEPIAAAKCLHFSHHWHDVLTFDVVNCEFCN